MATIHQDDFNRADSTNVPGTPTIGGAYTVRVGTWGIIGNQMYTSVSTGEALITYPSAADADISVVIAAGGTSAGIVHGWVSANDYWLLQVNAGQANMHRKAGGAFGQRGPNVNIVLPTTLRLVVTGTIVKMYVNGNLITTVDEAFPVGVPAVSGFRSSSSTGNRFEDLLVVDPVAPAPITCGLYSLGAVVSSNPLDDKAAYLYKGRDTKVLDTTSAS